MKPNLHDNLLLMKGSMKKPMLTMLVSMAVFLGLVAGFQAFKASMIKKYMIKNTPTEIVVSAIKVTKEPWQPKIIASGSIMAIQGVEVTTQISGQVSNIYFEAGATVKKDQELIKLSDSTEMAQLQALKAQAEIARITYERDREQFKIQAVSQQTVDTDFYNLQNLKAQVDQQQSVVDKKMIRAPFSGRLGIREVNLGQFLNPGDHIVSLQTLDPIFVDFYLPQQWLKHIEVGQTVRISCDAFPKEPFDGKITTINPNANQASRNIQVQATLANSKQQLLPGMYATVEVDTGKTNTYITLPQAAITYNSYGSSVYVVTDTKDPKGKASRIAKQTFVTLGDTRGDQVAILKGLTDSDLVITSGQVKLKNGSKVKVDDSAPPADNPSPKAKDD